MYSNVALENRNLQFRNRKKTFVANANMLRMSRNDFWPTVLRVALILGYSVVCPSVVCNVRIVAKRCVKKLTGKLSEEANRK